MRRSHRLGAARFDLAAVATGALLVACSPDAKETTESSPSASGGSGAGGAEPELPALVTEAGYVQVPGGVVGATNESRMFYSFRPAEIDPDGKPLLVLFNGGPGSATSAFLMAYGTGPYTFDHLAPVDTLPAPNPHRYTRFANVLYLDDRTAGFSYGLGPGEAFELVDPGDASYLTDAGDFAYVLLTFLEQHPRLRGARVVVGGESFGGTRGTLLLYLLQRYATEPLADGPIEVATRVPWLSAKVQSHFDALDPGDAGRPRTPDEVALQFGGFVSIQGSLGGGDQINAQFPLWKEDPSYDLVESGQRDPYDFRYSIEYNHDLDERPKIHLRNPATAELLLGVPLRDIPGLQAAQRGQAFRTWLDELEIVPTAKAEAALRTELGELARGDAYWLHYAPHCYGMLGDPRVVAAFFDVATRTRTLLTNARHDSVVYSKAIPGYLASFGYDVVLDESAPAGSARPGLLRWMGPSGPVEVRFPGYEAGHVVTASAGRELGEDIEAWFFSD
jgi:hypothetical protein